MIVDSHVHVFSQGFCDRADAVRASEPWFEVCHPAGKVIATAGELIGAMDEDEVDASVVMGWPFVSAALCREANDFAADIQRRHAGRIVGFGMVNPLDPAAPDEVRRCARLGLRGIGELNSDAQGWTFEGPEIARVAAAAQECGLIVNLHLSEPVGHDFPGRGTAWPARLLTWRARFPGVTTVASHLGGGLPFYATIAEVADACRNLWFDLSAGPFLYKPEAYAVAARACGSDRLLYGSDYPLLRRRRYERQFAASGLGKAELAAVMGGNAGRLFGLP